jgi:hypothetical protein
LVIHTEFDPDSELWLVKILPQLRRLCNRYPEYIPWGIEGIRNELLVGSYMLITFPDAFLIVEEDRDYMHAIIAAGFNGHVFDFAGYAKQTAEMAKACGYTGFKFTTPRQGWEKTAINAGFKVLAREVTYIYEI